jgi:hypothetical protein
MEWVSSNKELPEYGQEILGYVVCTCGFGAELHKLNCKYERYFIATYCEKDHQAKAWYDNFPDRKPNHWTYEDYWSPYSPDYWMPLPNQPERSKREDLHHKDCIPWIKHDCWHGYDQRHLCEHKEDCDNIVGARMRCSEHCGNTVREVQ